MILGDKVGLRLIEERDLSKLAEWRNDPRTLVNLNTQLEISHAGQLKYFEDLQNDPTRMQFMIVRLEDNRDIGTIGLIKIDYRNQSARPQPFQIDPAIRADLLGIDALNTLMRYAFEELNLHRVYGSVIAHNQGMLQGILAFGMKQEGIARKSTFALGEWRDAVYFSLLREEWKNLRWNRHNGGNGGIGR